jgi:hypothetical protein
MSLVQGCGVSDGTCRGADGKPRTFRICHVRTSTPVFDGAIDVVRSPFFTHHIMFR